MAAALRLASLRLRDCRWCSAHVGHLVCPLMAGAGQFRHLPLSLALRRCSWAKCRLYSMRSGVWFLARSYSWRCSGVCLAWGCLAVSFSSGLSCTTGSLGRSTLRPAFFFRARLGDARADRGLRGRGNVWRRVILLENSAGEPAGPQRMVEMGAVYPRVCGGTPSFMILGQASYCIAGYSNGI